MPAARCANSPTPETSKTPLRQVPEGAVAQLLEGALAELRLSTDRMDKEGIKVRVASRLQQIEAAASRRIGLGTGVLATIGSTGPFVGLFGTVWGIMNSFIGISKSQTTNLAVVAPGSPRRCWRQPWGSWLRFPRS